MAVTCGTPTQAVCQFCSARTADQFLGLNFNIEYSRHWRNLGLMYVYIVCNITAPFLLTYPFHMRTWSVRGFLRSPVVINISSKFGNILMNCIASR
ncbi:hypothetical protein JAAARDRAFT_296167 [Jaapia argillacea MUCL 33604]|uniref:CDR ABC transporter domain-containing protein n=1 Tax=Jaapia argillacea MUCL 33604 TaxID=933084 RepID=A0A067PRZ7_9AGAM|nr:hypothetical protein JAAARDRAFT_296167 [Jaapia argillacea MUCL 33604]